MRGPNDNACSSSVHPHGAQIHTRLKEECGVMWGEDGRWKRGVKRVPRHVFVG